MSDGTTTLRSADAYVPPQGTARFDLAAILGAVRPFEERQSRLFSGGASTSTERAPNRFCYGAGDLALIRRHCVAVVGTREASREGLARARRLARELAGAGVVVVSGLAKGIDAAAHTAAMEAGGATIAVIGTPLDRAYPEENKRLQEKIYREHLLVSPFAVGQPVQKHHFPLRNRVMAALSDATVIIEASDTSGTLHQAAECQRLGRWLFISKAVAEDRRLGWPARFLGKPKTAILEQTVDVLRAIQRSEGRDE